MMPEIILLPKAFVVHRYYLKKKQPPNKTTKKAKKEQLFTGKTRRHSTLFYG